MAMMSETGGCTRTRESAHQRDTLSSSMASTSLMSTPPATNGKGLTNLAKTSGSRQIRPRKHRRLVTGRQMAQRHHAEAVFRSASGVER